MIGKGPKAIKTKGRPDKDMLNVGIGSGHDANRRRGKVVRIKKPKIKGV